jgi:transcriptional regulator GlxA family with amidase domain
VGAYRFFGAPMHLLSHSTTEFGDVLGAEGDRLVARLSEAPTWVARFDLLDAWIGRRIDSSREPPEGLVWALHQLQNTHGRAPIAGLAAQLCWSRKRLLQRFREHVGLPAKTVARVLRFDHAMKRLEQREAASIAAVAADCGYADQAHMSREFRELSGWPPIELSRRNLSAGEGIVEP